MSKRIDYKALAKNIPHNVQVANKRAYEVLYSDTIKFDNNIMGETRFDPPQIVLQTGQSSREMVLTYWHEFLHAISEEHEVPLTESEVRRLERSFTYFYKFFDTLKG